MKKHFLIFLSLIVSLSCFADDTDLIYNGQFNGSENIDGWNEISNGDARANLSLIYDVTNWDPQAYRLNIEVTSVNSNPEFTDVLVTDSSTFSLTAGDSCYLEYYARSDKGTNQLQPMLISYDAVEGELTTIVFETRTLETAFNGMKIISATVAKAGTYQFAFACGSDADTYVVNNIILKTYAYVADGSPIISSFTVQMEEQGEQGENQIIGRAITQDAEGDAYTMSFSIVSGGGSFSIIDSTSLSAGGEANGLDTASFIYTEDAPGEKIFKVIVTDANGFSNSMTASYTVSDFDTAQLYFNEDVWNLVRSDNGYGNDYRFAFTENNDALPNVLLMGNSVSIGYTEYVQAALDGKANVYRIPDNGGSTLTMFENQDLWLGKTHWDVIHFNWGLHDLKYLLNNALNINGTQVVPVEEYGVNMDSIVRILTPQADHLIFATTSHIPSNAAGRIAGDEVIYNTAALAVMDNYPAIMIDDQYTLTNEYPEHNNDGDVHFTSAGKERQGIQAAAKILEALQGSAIVENSNEEKPLFYFDQEKKTLINTSNVEVNSIKVYSINGKIQSHIISPSESTELDKQAQGIYIVAATTENEKVVQKIVIR